MEYSIEINSGNFQSEVIEKSYLGTIVLDFYAVWCGPCQIVRPLLEKLAIEYNFTLVKVDIDKNPDLANKYGVEGVPDVRIVSNGEILPGFVGALPEEQLRDLFSRLGLRSTLESGLAEIQEAISLGDFPTAKKGFDRLFQKYPEEPRVSLLAVRFLVRLGKPEEARRILETIRDSTPAVTGWKTLLDFSLADASDRTDLDTLFFEGTRFALQEEYEKAMERFLQIVEESRKYRGDGARKALVAIFNILGMDNPAVKEYQQKLTFLLY
ncbi:tetratricopeptide repeat protein [Pannus brasiliensis CCIBt3594]|uniref:Tetratricopeptide repeat protein n=1 Tax=Pannus brasiliensis CCIBt3594 TaxID=1427578 RepID=A0AAW9QXL1_9CHRO